MFKPTINYPKSRLKYVILDNSVTVSIGSAITPVVDTTGERTRYAKPLTTGKPVLGVVVGFGEKEGGKVYKSFKGATSVTTAADNVTNEKIGVWYIPASDRNVEFVADVNADLGTTPGSTGFGRFSIADDTTLNEASYVVINSATGGADFVSYGKYMDEARKVVGRFKNVVE